MFLNLLQLLLLALFIIWQIFLEYLDWHGRSDVLKEKHPKLWHWVHNKPTRLTLLILCVAYLAKDFRDAATVAPPPKIVINVPTPPSIQIGTIFEPERPDSLRRRTMALAEEMQRYMLKRAQDSPPPAIPNSNDPNPSDEQKKAIEKFRNYQQDTTDYYSTHFKDRVVGIIREYATKGVNTGFLESIMAQQVPTIGWPGSAFQGTLDQFRELAYHVDAKDELIVITP